MNVPLRLQELDGDPREANGDDDENGRRPETDFGHTV